MSMPSEQPPVSQPWWLPNPPRAFEAATRPGLGWIAGNLVLILLIFPPLIWVVMLIDVVAPGHGQTDPDIATLQALTPIGTLVLYAVLGGLSLRAGWLLWRGRRRRDLRRAVICLCLLGPGQEISLTLAHWYVLSQQDVAIYDLWPRLWGILEVILGTVVLCAYLLWSPRLKRRFPTVADDLAQVF